MLMTRLQGNAAATAMQGSLSVGGSKATPRKSLAEEGITPMEDEMYNEQFWTMLGRGDG